MNLMMEHTMDELETLIVNFINSYSSYSEGRNELISQIEEILQTRFNEPDILILVEKYGDLE